MIDHDLKTGPRVIPVTVLTGFLGAGKTTLLNRILNGDHGLRVAVLVNDFGSINIDAELVVGVENDGNVVSLANGCVCCNIRDDLLAAVQEVIARPERPEYIVLEASGVAEPSGIAATFITVLVLWDLFGCLPLPLGVAGHEGSTVIVALNGMRLLTNRSWRAAATMPH